MAIHEILYYRTGAAGLVFPFGLENAVCSTVSLKAGMVAFSVRDGIGCHGWLLWVSAVFLSISPPSHTKHLSAQSDSTRRAIETITSPPLALSKLFSWRVLLTIPDSHGYFQCRSPDTRRLQRPTREHRERWLPSGALRGNWRQRAGIRGGIAVRPDRWQVAYCGVLLGDIHGVL